MKTRNTRKSHKFLTLFPIIVFLISGCTQPAEDGLPGKTSNPTTYHPAGWNDNPQHGIDCSTNAQNCKACHGNDLKGGSSGVSCVSCHHSVWSGTHGEAFAENPSNCKACHGEDLTGGLSGASCAGCHHNSDYPHNYHDGVAGGATHITISGCDGCHGSDYSGGHCSISCSAGACHTNRNTCKNAGCHQTLQSHPVHTVTNNKGPTAMACDGTCHHANPLNYTQLQDGKNLNATGVCHTCHSPGGTYDGAAMGKANWENGVYEEDGTTLKSGKDQWCATCHDEDPANSKIDGSGEDAPDVIGDEDAVTEYGIGYGFYKTGHGLPSTDNYPASGVAGAGANCIDCHDTTKGHIDHDHRTYQASSDNYQAGYRLADVAGGSPMDIPRNTAGWDNCNWYTLEQYQDFALCWQCHDRKKVLGGPQYKESSLKYYSRYAGNEYYQPQFTTNFRQCSTCNPSNSGTATAVTANTLTDASRATDWATSCLLVPDANHPELVYWITNLDNATHTITVGANIDMLADNPDLGVGSQFHTRARDVNSHNIHLAGRGGCGGASDWDSDWDGVTDSPMSCPACHNVHGSPTPRMTRHGELIGHIDAINFRYYDGGNCTWTLADESMTLDESGGGHTDFIGAGPGNVAKNGICIMCHNDNTCYARNPVFDPVMVTAVANDASGQGCGIQDGDEVVITFNKEIANPGVIDEVGDLYPILPIPGKTGEYWGTGTTVSWSNAGGHTNDTLTICLSANATIGLEDTIAADGSSLQDSNGKPIANQKMISGTFGCPNIIAANAQDENGQQDIQPGDQVIITFNLSTQGNLINSSNINTALALNNGHTWGTISSAVWLDGRGHTKDTLMITLNTGATIAPDDTITLGSIIKDSFGETIVGSVNLGGTFDLSSELVEIIIDNNNANNSWNASFEFVLGEEIDGEWVRSTGCSGNRYLEDYFRAQVSTTGETLKARWNFTIPTAGRYHVYAYYPTWSERAMDARFKVNHAEGSTTVLACQRSTCSGSGRCVGAWVNMGTFYFNKYDYSVELSNYSEDTPGYYIHADAVKIVSRSWHDSSEAEFILDNHDAEFLIDDNKGTPLFATEDRYFIWSRSICIPVNYGGNINSIGKDGNNEYSGRYVAKWMIYLTDPGWYRVYGWWPGFWDGYANNAPFTISHAGGTTEVRVNQRDAYEYWYDLGLYYFNAGSNHYITVSNDNSGGNPIADAIRLVRVETP